tara:strand:+ start:399 stop:542 length:144 start_codon:yes stop_codon:yes gene_type:complete
VKKQKKKSKPGGLLIKHLPDVTQQWKNHQLELLYKARGEKCFIKKTN